MLMLWSAVSHGQASGSREPVIISKDGKPVAAEVTYTGTVNIEFQLPLAEVETIAGVDCEIRSKTPCTVQPHPHLCRTLDAADEVRQSVWVGNNFGIWRLDADTEWKPFHIEVPVKRGVAKLRIILDVTGAAVKDVEVRNVRILQGGFPDNPPYMGPPYLDWIEALDANSEWEDHPKTTGQVIKTLPDSLKPYKALPINALIALMPDHRPFKFAENGLTIVHKQLIADTLKWTPAEPDVLRRPDGTIYDPDKEFKFDKFEEVIAPSGRKLLYAYYDPPRDQWEKMTPDNLKQVWGFDKFTDPPLCRVYKDAFMTEVRSRELLRACNQFARHYAGTGDRDSGLRAAAIMYSLAQVIRDFPVHGQGGVKDKIGFLPPDSYDYWFAFIVGNWYTPTTSMSVSRLLDDFSMVRDAALWKELNAQVGGDTRKRVVDDVFMYLIKTSLKYDAFLRCNPWMYFHNTIGGQLQGVIKVGRRLGCPDLVHYSIRKAEGAFKFTFMADGMFPESTSYLHDMTDGLAGALNLAKGYTDPDGFSKPIDSRRYRELEPAQAIPLYGMAKNRMEQLTFPHGDPTTIHDTWPGGGTGCSDKDSNSSYLIPDFGHAALGWGADPFMVEAHLHFSGAYGHRQLDMLNFTLWAYTDELASDLGYTHFGAYLTSTPIHNLVVVDGKEQSDTARGDLLAFLANPAGVQIVQAADTKAYAQSKLYRRLLVTVPFGPGRDAIVDVFEVDGGSRHDWTANGCADYNQTIETTLPVETDPAKAVSSLAPDGKISYGDTILPIRYAPAGDASPFYGAFRIMPGKAQTNGRICPWQVTMRSPAPVPTGTIGASARATSTEKKASLRLHYLGPEDATPILTWAPRHRYPEEGSVWADKKRFTEFWNSNLMPKVFARRDGQNLKSTFVAVWEPFMDAPHLAPPERIMEIDEKDGVALRLRSGGDDALVLYRKPECTVPLNVGAARFDGRYAVLCSAGTSRTLTLAEATSFENEELTVELAPVPANDVLDCKPRGGASVLTIGGTIDPALAIESGGADQWLRFAQEGQGAWFLPVASVKNIAETKTEIVLTRIAGFEYDGADNILRETFYPFRIIPGKATARFPVNASLTWQRTPEGGLVLSAQSSTTLHLRLKGMKAEAAAKLRITGQDEWKTLPVTVKDGIVNLTLTPDLLVQGQATLVVAESTAIDEAVERLSAPGAVASGAAKSVKGRYVRIELPGLKRSLGIAEIQVFDSLGTNKAPTGTATMSSPPYSDSTGADKANDGNTDGNFWNGSVTHGALDVADPWFELDLKEDCDISKIAIWNRTDAVPFRIAPFRVLVLDSARNLVKQWDSSRVRTRYLIDAS